MSASASYYQANRDRILRQKQGYYRAHRNRILNRARAYREANRDRLAQYQRTYRAGTAGGTTTIDYLDPSTLRRVRLHAAAHAIDRADLAELLKALGLAGAGEL